jgi:hypothetical protein
MKRSLVVVLVVLMLAGLASSQKLSPVPADEQLYPDRELEIRPGWRLATSSDPDPNGKQVSIYYDTARTTKYTTGYRAWIKQVKSIDGEESTALFLEDFDCQRHQFLIVESVEYDQDGTALHGGVGSWTNLVPDSLGETTYNIFCGGQRDKQWTHMVAAERYFAWGRQEEKKKRYQSALHWYRIALQYAPNHPKILAAIERADDPLGIDRFLRENPQTSGVSPEVAEMRDLMEHANKPRKRKGRAKKP